MLANLVEGWRSRAGAEFHLHADAMKCGPCRDRMHQGAPDGGMTLEDFLDLERIDRPVPTPTPSRRGDRPEGRRSDRRPRDP